MLQTIIERLREFNICENDIEKYVITDRGDASFATVITNKDKVFKIPLKPKGIKNLKVIIKNHNMLINNGISALPMKIINGIGVMDRVYHPTVREFVKTCVHNSNTDDILKVLDIVFNDIKKSSIYTDKPDSSFLTDNILKWGGFLKYGCIEILPQNVFYDGEKAIYFDQEYLEFNITAGFIFARFIRHLYFEVPELEFLIPLNKIVQRYDEFSGGVWKEYGRITYEGMSKNDRENNSLEINKLNNNIIIVGAGTYCRVFMYILKQLDNKNVLYICDNDSGKWNKFIDNIPIRPINRKNLLNQDVVVAVKENNILMRQLANLGIDLNRVYLLNLKGFKIHFTGGQI